jgi:spore coat polysaccharide biosynthesis predicted glycosyltransferase SpsG
MADTLHGGRARTAVFRLEWGGKSGWGHLVRCTALASELGTRAWRCVLWTRGAPGGLPEELRGSFAETAPVHHSRPLEVPDAIRGADWLVVDDYGFDDDALRGLRAALACGAQAPGPRLLVLDDEASRRLDAADLVINTRLGLRESPYAPGVPALTGESFVLLRAGLRTPDPVGARFLVGVDPVLVMIGGTDPAGLTVPVLEALSSMEGKRFAPILVRARRDESAPEIRRMLRKFPASTWLENVSAATLAGWARACRFAVSGAGGSLYELAFLQLPFVALVVADNQRNLAAEVNRRWNMPILEARMAQLRPALAAAVGSLLARPPGWSTTTCGIDGGGAGRIADAMAGR